MRDLICLSIAAAEALLPLRVENVFVGRRWSIKNTIQKFDENKLIAFGALISPLALALGAARPPSPLSEFLFDYIA